MDIKYVFLLGAIIFVVWGIVLIRKKDEKVKQPMIAAAVFIVLTTVFFIADNNGKSEEVSTSISGTDTDSKVELTNDSKTFSTSAYLDELDSLVSSVSSNIDVNWKLYLIEPLTRLEQGGDFEAFKSDVGVLVFIYKGVLKEVDEIKIPSELTLTDQNDLYDFKDSLSKSIKQKIFVANTLMNAKSGEDAVATEILEDIEEGNEHLKKSVKAYGRVVERHTK